MRAILTGVVATIEAIAVALASLLVVAGLAFLVWWLAFDLGSEPSEVFAGAGAAWLLAHFVPLSLELSPETMQLLGFAPEALKFTLSLAPLGLTLVTVGFAVRAGWRFGARGGAGSAGVLGGALGFGAVAGILHSAVTLAQPGWFATAVTAALVYGLSSGGAYLVRAARDEHDWWTALLAAIETGLAKLGVPRPAVFPHRAGQTLRLAAMLVAGYVGIAAVSLAIALLTRFTVVIAASESLQLDLWGTILMFVVQLALLPVLVLWTGAWLSGAGFAVGVGSSASPFGQLLGPMPGVPVLAAIPEGWGSAAVLAPVVLALVGVGIGVALGEVARRQTLPRLAAQVLVAAVLAGLAIALGNWAASGSLGPGRLAVVGPEVWAGAGLAAGALGIGCFLGALAARADIARRVAAAPGGVASKLGLGDERDDLGAGASRVSGEDAGAGLGGDAADADAMATDVVADLPADGAGTVRGDGEPEPRLAPVARLQPRGMAADAGSWDTDSANASPADGGWGIDEQPTERIEHDEHDGWAASQPGGAEPQPDPRTQPEPELFDQHDAAPRRAAGQAVDPADASSHDPALPHAADAPLDASADGALDPALDPEALVEAYSWDGVDLEAAPEEAPKRTGWRWPRRKG